MGSSVITVLVKKTHFPENLHPDQRGPVFIVEQITTLASLVAVDRSKAEGGGLN
jgi:hypothetical protein